MIELPGNDDDKARAHWAARITQQQKWRVDHTETSHLTDYETSYWGWEAELRFARYLGVWLPIELTGSHPAADIATGGLRYEVRGTPWIKRREFDRRAFRTFVYPREVADRSLVIARVDSFLQGCRVFLTGWLWAWEAAAWPLDPGRHLTRHAVMPDGLRDPASIPRLLV